MRMPYEVGTRVVCGPDFENTEPDGSEGNVGTVVEVLEQPSSDDTVAVLWDTGVCVICRVGHRETHDLRVFDNGPAGIQHAAIGCDSCQEHSGIVGIRWSCSVCSNFNLCSICYHAGMHNLSHPFIIFEKPHARGTALPPRLHSASRRFVAQGIFPGAKVERGPDWDWGNQDGGKGCTGEVLTIQDWLPESGRSVALVKWSTGNINVYRVGHHGIVDLKCVEPAPSWGYYVDHLPKFLNGLDASEDNAHQQPATALHCGLSSPWMPSRPLAPADYVRVLPDLKRLVILQERHGGWNPRMADCVGRVGKVHRITKRGDIRVQLITNERWTFHPDALEEFPPRYPHSTVRVGSIVRVIDDLQQFRMLQRGHGGYVQSMESTLGSLGQITNIYNDGDVRVAVGVHTWTMNTHCVCVLPFDLYTGHGSELNGHDRCRTTQFRELRFLNVNTDTRNAQECRVNNTDDAANPSTVTTDDRQLSQSNASHACAPEISPGRIFVRVCV